MNSRRLGWRLPQGELELGARTFIMGVVNVTPDSFSDGGHFFRPDEAVAQGVKLAAEGADILDVGGESTRPGSEGISGEDEIKRVLPVIQGLRSRTNALISIDTQKTEVAEKALEAGAQIINDISALRTNPQMAALAARTKAGLVLMHMKGTPRTMQENPHYDDVVAEIKQFLAERAQFAQSRGVEKSRIVIDPGIGFGKTFEHNLTIMRHLAELADLGYPVLLGASRKSFIGRLTGRPAPERLWGTVGAHVAGALLGAHLVRVHDVAPLKEALLVSDAIMRAQD